MRYNMRHNRGFTLIELLVVMAISVILMGLLLGPVVKSFQLTRAAQAMVDSQDAARSAMQDISREMGQAMFVYDNATYETPSFNDGSTPSTLTGPVKAPIMLPVAKPGGGTDWFVLPYAKIDFILPKLYMHCNNPEHTGGPRDYPREAEIGSGGDKRLELYGWPECPYCHSTDVEARPKLPLEQDVTVVRYFLAVKRNNVKPSADASTDPNKQPNDGWISPYDKNIVAGTENQVVLYRAEFNPRDPALFPPKLIQNLDHPENGMTSLEDPVFFYRKGSYQGVEFWDRWRQISRIVGVGKYEDLVTAQTDPSTGAISSVQPTITFRTASIENDTFAATFTSDKLNEYPNCAPSVFSAKYGYWTPNHRVDVLRGDFSVTPPQGVDYYTEYQNGNLMVMKLVPGDPATVTPEFNITQYLKDGFVPPDSSSKTQEMAFTVDANKGTVNFALQPPRQDLAKVGPVCTLNPAMVNAAFHDEYRADRGSAVRRYWLDTFNSSTNQYLKNARIVPGSDRVIGPDMTPGQHYGLPVRYERVPLALGDPGLNQYKVDCDAGWIYFSSDPSLNLPELDGSGNAVSPIEVNYLVYFNQKDDVVRGDYLTKSLININLGMRMFDPDAAKAHPTDLTDSVKIRNALR